MDTALELILARAAERPDDVEARMAAAFALERELLDRAMAGAR